MEKSNLIIIPDSFYNQATAEVAKNLLGKILKVSLNNSNQYFKIVETEAYLGLSDPAAHSFHGKITNRTKHMYAPAGSVYIYLIYGLHFCLNIVTQDKTIPEAVLIRALQPLSDLNLKTNGPGLIGSALNLNLTFNGLRVFDKESPLQILQNNDYIAEEISTSARIGIFHPIAKHWA